MEASIHSTGSVNGALGVADTQSHLSVNKCAARSLDGSAFLLSCYSFCSKVLFNDPKNGTLENPAAVRYQADENIYIENNLYNVHSDSVAH